MWPITWPWIFIWPIGKQDLLPFTLIGYPSILVLTINKSDRKTVEIVIELVSLVHSKRMRKPKTYNVMNLKIIISHATQNILDPQTKKKLGLSVKTSLYRDFHGHHNQFKYTGVIFCSWPFSQLGAFLEQVLAIEFWGVSPVVLRCVSESEIPIALNFVIFWL